MQINRAAILDKTHYGLNIYAFVLRQYYPGETVLSLAGRDCKPAQNPFNDNNKTLIVKVVNGCAVHSDSENAIPPGDVFDFAEMHIGLKGQNLLNKLNELMHLGIDREKWFYNSEPVRPAKLIQNIGKPTSPRFSLFAKPVTNVQPKGIYSLVEVYNLIKGDGFSQQTARLRVLDDPAAARKYKAANFDYVTFSGTFSRRYDAGLIKHSGLMTIDFDHIENLDALRHKLLNDRYFFTELLFVSPSGDGLKWVIPADLSKICHKEYFIAVANYIRQAYGLEIDPSGKDVSRACFLPHDPQVFINPKYV